MSGPIKREDLLGDEIDMDRVVFDQEYRRRVISRLRQERLAAEAQRFEAGLASANWQGEED